MILLNYQVKIIMWDAQACQNIKIFGCIAFLHNYFDGLTKLFSDLYLAKFLNMIF